MNVLMIGVDESTKGGMWTVVENYLNDRQFVQDTGLVYIPTSVTGCSALKKIAFTLAAYIKIVRAFNSRPFDILHVHMSERASIIRKGIVMRYAKRKGTKIVLHMHGAEFAALYRDMGKRQQAKVKKVIDLADRIIVLGEYWQQFMNGLAADPAKIRVIYNAVSVPERYEYNTESNKLLFLGEVSKRKGIDVLLDAVSKRKNELEGYCELKVFGPDTHGNIEDKIKEYKLTGLVSYCGWLDKNRKPEVFKDTAVNVLPSYNEGLPMTILETMSYGIPSVTTSVGAIPEAVNGRNGITVEPGDPDALGDALVSLVHDRERRLSLSKEAYSTARSAFSISHHISQVQALYRELQEL